MHGKRVTIYHIAQELGMSASYVSRALNDHPKVNPKIREKVKKKALELNYRHNLQAANLRTGSSKTIGVIVPHIDQSFFSEAIAGIEEVCSQNQHSLIICQSHESYELERKAVETLIHQNVNCVIISLAIEKKSIEHLESVKKSNIEIIQFDRCADMLDSYQVLNNNKETSYKVVRKLIGEGYKNIAFIGGPDHLVTFRSRREGYIKAVKESGLAIPYNFIVQDALSKEEAVKIAAELLALKNPPDAFFTVSDYQALGIFQLAESLGIKVPEQLGIFGYANEKFTEIIRPGFSSVDQKSKEMGKCAANLYFNNRSRQALATVKEKTIIIPCKIIERETSVRRSSTKKKKATEPVNGN